MIINVEPTSRKIIMDRGASLTTCCVRVSVAIAEMPFVESVGGGSVQRHL